MRGVVTREMIGTAMIKKAIPADVIDIKSCAEEAYADFVALIGQKPAPMIADFASCIRKGDVYVVSDAANSVAGFIIFYQCENHMFLENVAVRKASRGKGVGKALVAYCEAEARQLGLTSMVLYTNEKMPANLEIYPHLGFVEIDRKKESGFNRVYFRKALD